MIGMALAMLAAGVAGGPGADDARAPRAQALAPLHACRAIADEKQRLACYDRELPAFETAEQERRVVVLDQEQVKTTRRSLFGFSLPSLRLFGGGGGKDAGKADDARDELASLDAPLRTVDRLADGQVAFTLDNGARWVQTDGRTISLARIRPGTQVKITRGSLGSYFAAFAGGAAIKVRRVG